MSDAKSLLERDWSFQGFAFHQLHHQVVRADIVEMADVGMIQRGNRTGLALETLAEFLCRNLDGDFSAKPRVTSQVHLAHAAGANGREDLVGAETVTYSERH